MGSALDSPKRADSLKGWFSPPPPSARSGLPNTGLTGDPVAGVVLLNTPAVLFHVGPPALDPSSAHTGLPGTGMRSGPPAGVVQPSFAAEPRRAIEAPDATQTKRREASEENRSTQKPAASWKLH